jgi:hypothetical protein
MKSLMKHMLPFLALGLAFGLVSGCGNNKKDENSSSGGGDLLPLQGSCIEIYDGVVEDCINYRGSSYTATVISNDCDDEVVMGTACPTATALRKCTIKHSSTAQVEYFKYDPDMPDTVFEAFCSKGTLSTP